MAAVRAEVYILADDDDDDDDRFVYEKLQITAHAIDFRGKRFFRRPSRGTHKVRPTAELGLLRIRYIKTTFLLGKDRLFDLRPTPLMSIVWSKAMEWIFFFVFYSLAQGGSGTNLLFAVCEIIV